MWMQILNWLMKHKGAAKISGGVATGSGIVALIFTLHQDLKNNVNRAEARSQAYTDHRIAVMIEATNNLKAGQKEIKQILIRLDNRLYELKDQ